MAKASIAVVILSTGSTRKLVLKTASKTPFPVWSKYAVMNDEPLAVMPPYRYTAIGVETMAAVSATRKPVIATFHQFLNNPALAQKPVTRPIKKATGHQGKAFGSMASPQMMLESVPVNAPAQGPHSAATSIVPIESR